MKPNFLPKASTLAARSTPGERKTKIGIPGLVSCNNSRLPWLLHLNSKIANAQLDTFWECAYLSTCLAAGFDVTCILAKLAPTRRLILSLSREAHLDARTGIGCSTMTLLYALLTTVLGVGEQIFRAGKRRLLKVEGLTWQESYLERSLKGEWIGGDELLANCGRNKSGKGCSEPVGPECPHNDQPVNLWHALPITCNIIIRRGLWEESLYYRWIRTIRCI